MSDTVKKRGRKKKLDKKTKKQNIKKYFSSTLRSKVDDITNSSANILHITVNEEIEDSIYSLGALKNKDKVDTELKKETNFQILSEFVKDWNHTTSIHCWNCATQFENTPIGFPVNFTNKEFVLHGIFCSFACSIRHAKDRNIYMKNKHHIAHLYKIITGGNPEELFCAPHIQCLDKFGGRMTIEEYRRSTESKIYKYIKYPMHISRDYIEEIDLQTIKEANDYVFKKTKIKPVKHNIHDFLK